MSVQPGALTAIDTTVDLSGYSTAIATYGNDRMLHNQTQLVMAQFQSSAATAVYRDNPLIRYYFLNGNVASSYVVQSGTTNLTRLYDIAYDSINSQFYTVGLANVVGSAYLKISAINSQGAWIQDIISTFDCGLSYNSTLDLTFADYDQGKIMLTVDTAATPNIYLKVEDALYKFPVSVSGTGYATPASLPVTASGTIFDPTAGSITSLNWVGYSGQDYVTYLKYDSGSAQTFIERISDTT
jgi:virulence-associated protein VapD